MSSDQVYNGNRESGPFKEGCQVSPATVYGRHKLEAEKEIMKVLADPVILRLTWLFGLPEEGRKISSNILWNIIRAEKEGRAISLPVNEYRGITDVYDLIRTFEKIMCLPGGIYNTGSENDLSTYGIGMLAAEAMGFSVGRELVMKDAERYKLANRDLRIDNEKLRNAGVVFPKTSEAIKKIPDWSFKPIR
jgi:dTDP-4-dehydrorhamnose reductase